MTHRSVSASYENSRADKLGMLAMGLLVGGLLLPLGGEVAGIATLACWSVWPLVDGYHHEVVRT